MRALCFFFIFFDYDGWVVVAFGVGAFLFAFWAKSVTRVFESHVRVTAFHSFVLSFFFFFFFFFFFLRCGLSVFNCDPNITSATRVTQARFSPSGARDERSRACQRDRRHAWWSTPVFSSSSSRRACGDQVCSVGFVRACCVFACLLVCVFACLRVCVFACLVCLVCLRVW